MFGVNQNFTVNYSHEERASEFDQRLICLFVCLFARLFSRGNNWKKINQENNKLYFNNLNCFLTF